MALRVGRTLLVGSALLTTACSLDLQGLGSEGDSAGKDGGQGTPGPADASTLDDALQGESGTPGPGADTGATDGSRAPDAGTTPRPPYDAGACANAAGPCINLPSGWTLVAFAPTQTTPCPAGFDSAPGKDVVEGPDVSGACACGACSVTSSASCASGALKGSYDYRSSMNAGSCATPDTPVAFANSPPGSCSTDFYQGDYSNFDVEYYAPSATGGTCTAAGAPQPGAVTYAGRGRACTANSAQAANCTGDVCRPTLPAPYGACIASTGALDCPPGPLAVRHVVGTSSSFSCGNCSCAVTATCSGTITLFPDASCKGKGAFAIATSVCVAMTNGASYMAYEYRGDPPQNVACKTAGAGPGQGAALTDEATFCCAQ